MEILRCAESKPSRQQAHLLQLDSTSTEAQNLMSQLGNADAHETFRWTQGNHRRGAILERIFERMPETNHSERR